MHPSRPRNPAGPTLGELHAADRARDDVARAMARLGLTLPSLRVDAAGAVPMVSLGACSVPTALLLAAALGRAPAAQEAGR
ncbi:hypothetical protein ABT160_01555 [Streptomyces sp. NPDC001941]|uniref:hypothetical protein n=1 Tax=Streptomyces sp. NPDC001941 TaxID=3154659 RepID=UPI003333562F